MMSHPMTYFAIIFMSFFVYMQDKIYNYLSEVLYKVDPTKTTVEIQALDPVYNLTEDTES